MDNFCPCFPRHTELPCGRGFGDFSVKQTINGRLKEYFEYFLQTQTLHNFPSCIFAFRLPNH